MGCHVSLPIPEGDLETGIDGSRLRARRWVGEDGSSRFVEWWDEARGARCAFRFTSDGAQRCVPKAPSPELFGDRSCSIPVMPAGTRCGEPVVADFTLRTLWDYSCGATGRPEAQVEVYETGETVVTEAWALDFDGRCELVEGLARRTLGSLIPNDRFVAGRLVNEPTPGRLGALALRADDGSGRRVGIFDRVLVQRCDPEAPMAVSGRQCMPPYSYVSWADPTCTTTPVTSQFSTSSCPPVLVAVDFRPETEDGEIDPHFYAIGEETDLSVGFGGQFTADCDAWTARATFYSVHEEPDLVATLESAIVGTTRLQSSAYQDAMGGAWPHGDWWDAERSSSCSPRRTSEGLYRCLPRAWTRESPQFADDACRTPAIQCTGPCTGRSLLVLETSGDGCDVPWSVTAIYETGAITERLYELTDAGVCAPIDTPDAGYLLTPVPFEAFVRMERLPH